MLGCLTSGWPLGLWAPVPARGPQAEKEREGKGKATGTPGAKEPESQRGPKCNRRAFPICRGLVPGKGRPPERSRDWQPDAWLSLVWVAFGLVGPVPARGPQAKKEKGKGKATGTPESQRAREAREAKSATDGLFLYVGASFPARGGPPERSRDWEPDAWLAYVWVAFGFVGPVPARGSQAKKERGKGKATGTPGAKGPES